MGGQCSYLGEVYVALLLRVDTIRPEERGLTRKMSHTQRAINCMNASVMRVAFVPILLHKRVTILRFAMKKHEHNELLKGPAFSAEPSPKERPDAGRTPAECATSDPTLAMGGLIWPAREHHKQCSV